MGAQERVQRYLDDLVDSGQETGLQVAAYVRGRPVVDAAAGTADPSTGRPVDHRTLFHSWSTGKGLSATVIHVLAERKLLDYGAPVADYWPEFAAEGKHRVTVAHVLTHSAGVPQAPDGLTVADLADWDGMCARVAALPLLWEPGTATGYHALTFGYILGEVVRRTTGRSIAEVLREDVAEPLGIADELFFGVPAAYHDRLARLEDGTWPDALAARHPDSLFFRAAPPALQAGAALGNRPDYLSADVPCAATMTAHAAARLYAALTRDVDGVRLVPAERLAALTAVATAEVDLVLGAAIPKCLGYFRGLAEFGGRPGAFGSKGSGGSFACADPAGDLAIAFTHNRMAAPPHDLAARIAGHVRDALAGRR
ncbi:serine hydrolase domain-containing protein [Amorphoplanes nipponensis]|uniref:Esterase n=1 Tax=Actinoplanes nipponensis TaxID=135950 RepID=A0A919JCU1_9ACTN|nr:serine hydrolase domain-containing protein [Actinoplanes nipponensis]GIE47453.1 esterase [Actinoplanes nipponensis]